MPQYPNPIKMMPALAVALLLFVSILPAQRGAIIFTGSANGAYQNCLCPDKPYGGLARRVQFIEELRSSNPNALVIDAGDNFIDYLSVPIENIMVKGFTLIDYDVIHLGDQDIAFAPENYYGLSAVVSVLGQEISVTKGDVTYSILPIIHPKTARFYPDGLFEAFALEGWEEAVRSWLAKGRAERTVMVLLSHAGFDQDRKIAQQYPEIDVIVGGHSQTELPDRFLENGVVIVHAGGNAGFVGELAFKVRRKDIKISSYDLHPITLSLPVHPEMLELIEQISSGH